jgi:ficolin
MREMTANGSAERPGDPTRTIEHVSVTSRSTVIPGLDDISDASDCADILQRRPGSTSGVYNIVSKGFTQLAVYCDMTTNGGGWTVFQRRQDGSENFYRPWNDYAAGFGRLTGEFWLGNDNLAALTSTTQCRLRVDLRDWYNNAGYAEYSLFKVGDASTNYTLTSLGSYSGNTSDLLTYHLGMKFSTYDRDNDLDSYSNCAQTFFSAWWYNSCYHSDLNALYNSTAGFPWGWWPYSTYPNRMVFTEMKIRPANV